MSSTLTVYPNSNVSARVSTSDDLVRRSRITNVVLNCETSPINVRQVAMNVPNSVYFPEEFSGARVRTREWGSLNIFTTPVSSKITRAGGADSVSDAMERTRAAVAFVARHLPPTHPPVEIVRMETTNVVLGVELAHELRFSSLRRLLTEWDDRAKATGVTGVTGVATAVATPRVGDARRNRWVYEPEVSPQLIWYPSFGSCFNFFTSGKINVTGIKNESAIGNVVELIRHVARECCVEI